MSNKKAMNVSYDGSPVRFYSGSRHLVLVDPIVLDALSEDLRALRPASEQAPSEALSGWLDAIGYYEIDDFHPGFYELDVRGLRQVNDITDAHGATRETFSVDSGAFIVVDYSRVGKLASLLTWEQYDQALRAPPGDDSAFIRISEALGAPCYAIVHAHAGSADEFDGDGVYMVMEGSIKFKGN